MLTNFNQLPVTDEELADNFSNEELETANEEVSEATNETPSYSYVDPKLYQRWCQETQQETPLDRKLLAILEFIDRLEGRDEEKARKNRWLKHWKRKYLFLVILPALAMGFFSSLLFWLRK